MKYVCPACGVEFAITAGAASCPVCGTEIEKTRSGLFIEAVRIIKEMRKKTNGKQPRFAVWENVPGAFSSNKGRLRSSCLNCAASQNQKPRYCCP